MAIEIIKNPNEQKHVVTCPNCDCVFSFLTADTYKVLSNRHVICPNCGNSVQIDNYAKPVVKS